MPSPRPPGAPPLSRRDLLTGLATGVVAAPLVRMLAACDEASTGATDTRVADADASDSDTRDATTSDSGANDTTVVAWLSGGTAGMSGDYPDPFDAAGETCALFCAMTLGPCHAETVERRDISEGYPGLPVRLALQVVDETCAPIPNALVDVWHTRNTGLYSGPDAFIFCTLDDADAASHRYFRGVQRTDAAGRVDFDTCLPGWYIGRAIHIHFRVLLGEDAHVVSQLFFSQALTEEICGSHIEYASRGLPDTTNDDDPVLAGALVDPYLLSWSKQPDGAMLAWKRLVIRSSPATTLCSVDDEVDGPP